VLLLLVGVMGSARIIGSGLFKVPAIADYWSVSAESYFPWIHHVFSRERFQDIYHTMLHSGDEAAEGKDKIEQFMNLLLCKFRKAFYLFQELSIDEMVIGYKGRWKFKQLNGSKPNKYHSKTFGLYDGATGFVVDIQHILERILPISLNWILMEDML
jgi:hypothetical protein